MTKTKADRIMRGWFGTKGEESSQEVVADKDIYLWSSAGKSGTIFSGRGDGTEWI